MGSVRDRIPFTMKELLACYNKRKCSQKKKNLFTHVRFGDDDHR